MRLIMNSFSRTTLQSNPPSKPPSVIPTTALINMSIRQDLPSCLRWNIFGALHDIEIVSGTNEHGQQMRTPLFSHPIATQSLARPPLSRVKINSVDVTEAQAFNFVSEDFEYTGLLIEHEDGRPVTVGEFVMRVHEHLNQFKRVITAMKSAV
jgi:hypothetical protein